MSKSQDIAFRPNYSEMHREYRPEDLHHLERRRRRSRQLAAAWTTTIERSSPSPRSWASLIGGDVLLGLLGWGRRLPLGLSLALVAAILGAVYIVYGALQALLQRRIGADLALAQASLAALVLGQPFVAAEVVFIALLGEVLEAWTFSRARRAMGRLVEQTPRTARVRRDGPGGRDPRAPGRGRRSGDRAARRARPRRRPRGDRSIRPSISRP